MALKHSHLLLGQLVSWGHVSGREHHPNRISAAHFFSWFRWKCFCPTSNPRQSFQIIVLDHKIILFMNEQKTEMMTIKAPKMSKAEANFTYMSPGWKLNIFTHYFLRKFSSGRSKAAFSNHVWPQNRSQAWLMKQRRMDLGKLIIACFKFLTKQCFEMTYQRDDALKNLPRHVKVEKTQNKTLYEIFEYQTTLMLNLHRHVLRHPVKKTGLEKKQVNYKHLEGFCYSFLRVESTDVH